jgi:hypothetical protein
MKDVKITLGSSPDGGARSSPEAGPDGGAPQHQTITIGRLEVKVVPAVAEEGSFAFVFEGNVVLSTDASDAWVTGRPARKSTTSGMGEEIVRRVDAAKLPNSLRGWKGRTVKLYDFDGPVCTTRITGFQQMRRVIPHFSETSGWSEQRASESRIARELWDEAGGSDLLLGTVADESTCARATWARLPSFRTPKLTSPETADDALAARALGAFRKLDAWQKIQADFRSETGEKTGQWDLYDGAHPTVNRLGRLVYVSAAAGNGCGEFGANLFALWELVGGKLVPRNKPGDFFLDPRAAVDLDGDGVPEILIDEGIVRRSGDFYSNPENLYVPNHDCPC